MFVVSEAFDDNSAVIIDLSTYSTMDLCESELIKLEERHDVLGLSVSNHKLNYINAYSFMQFPTEDEADDYIKDCGLSYKNKRYVNGYYWVLERKNKVIHVDYYVYTQAGDEITFVGPKQSDGKILYTPYIQSAKSFEKEEAYKVAGSMTKASRTGKYWYTKRVVKRW